MKYISILIFALFLCSSCGGQKQEENPSGKVPLGEGATIPVLKTEKSRKSKLSFNLTEVIRKDDKVDIIVMISNNGDDAMVHYIQEELALTDNNGYIHKVSDAKIDKTRQFDSEEDMVRIPKNGKIKSILSFERLRDDALSGKLFFKGEAERDKTSSFKIEFNKVQLRK